MSAIHYIARPWQCHAATSVGYEVDGGFVQVAECSGFGRTAEDAVRAAAQIVAALNAAEAPDKDGWTTLDTHYASEVCGIRALPKPVTWTELHRFATHVADRVSSAMVAVEAARLRTALAMLLRHCPDDTDPEAAGWARHEIDEARDAYAAARATIAQPGGAS